jgi:hypothetical protein
MRRLCVLTCTLLLLLLGASVGSMPATADVPLDQFESNLIVNPGAEDGLGETEYSAVSAEIPGWSTTGTASVFEYGGHSELPTSTTAGPDDRGANLFTGGASPAASFAQDISLESARFAIATGGVSYELEGWFGGYGSENDRASLTLRFFDADGAPLDQITIGPVTNSDRGSTTSLHHRVASGGVPSATVSASVTLVMTRTCCSSFNNGYADNLSLELSTPERDLAISLDGPVEDVEGGSTVVLLATASNLGPAEASEVSVSVTVPAGLDVLIVQPSTGTCEQTNCSLGALEAGETQTVRIEARGSIASLYRAIATVSGAETEIDDSDNSDDAIVRVVDTVPPQVDLTNPQPSSIHIGPDRRFEHGLDERTVIVGGGSVMLQATATDAMGVPTVTFTVDGEPVCVDDSPPYACEWAAPIAAGDRVIAAVATDINSNTATDAVSATVI